MNKVIFSILSSLLFLCLFLVTRPGLADEAPPTAALGSPASFAELYKTGVQYYQTKDYEKARDAFAKALEKEPRSPFALTNLALAQFKLNQKGWSIGLLRKSLEIDPEQPTAKTALKFVISQLEIKEVPHQIETYENIRADFLQPITLNIYLLLTALFLFAAGWTLFSYIGKRRKALQSEESLPSFPLISLIFALGFLVGFSLVALKIYDASLKRGTIVEDKVTVQAAPGENQVTLFDLHAGFEVLIRNEDKDWIQVTYPGASTGWVKKSAVLITTEQDR